MANFLTYGQSFCFHDALIDCRSMDDLMVKMEGANSAVVGNSDSGNIFFLEEIQSKFDNAKFIIILREPSEVGESMKNIGFQCDHRVFMRAHHQLLDLADSGIPAYWYDKLDKENSREIYEYITETEFNPQRWELLSNLMVEVNVDYLHKKIENYRGVL